MRNRSWIAFVMMLGLAALVGNSRAIFAEVTPERPGRVEELERPFSPHWIWAADLLLERIALIDLDEGRFLGMVDGGYGPITPLFSIRRGEIYVPSTFYSRRTRGERTDAVVIFDATSLAAVAEVQVPGKRALDAVAMGHSALSDDERFIALFNLTPATSLSIVDVERRVFTGEISIPGCSLVYGAGDRRFLSLCGDGSALVITVDEEGREVSKVRSRRFFDPVEDPVTEKAARWGDSWIFVSFEGHAHAIDVSQAEPQVAESWSLPNDAEREASWRIGGIQHLAVHQPSGRLYSLMHRGGRDTHKDPGEEVWVYDLETRRRLQRIVMRNPGITVMGFPIDVGADWIWPFNGLWNWIIDTLAPPMVGQIEVTQDDSPLLVTGSRFSGSLGIYDAISGDFVRRVQGIGMTTDILEAPWLGSSQ